MFFAKKPLGTRSSSSVLQLGQIALFLTIALGLSSEFSGSVIIQLGVYCIYLFLIKQR